MTETLLSRTPRDQLPEALGQAWDTLNRLTGEPAFIEAFASAPEVLNLVMNEFYAKIFFGGRVENRYKQLARLYLSLNHGCRTCNLQNVPGALEAGVTRAQIDHLLEFETGPFTDAERAVLRFAHQMLLTNPAGELTPELYEALSAHFSDAEICELGACMAMVGGFAKLSFVLGLVEKESYCEFGSRRTADSA